MPGKRWHLRDLPTALEWVAMRNEQGIRCIVDVLGEYSLGQSQTDEALECYIDLIDSIAEYELDASVTVKLTTLGAIFDPDLALANVLAVAENARARDVEFEMDMEAAKFVQMTLEAAERLRDVTPLTLSMQAYLHRTAEDIEEMDGEVRVRLVKGAYAGDVEDFDEIEEMFMKDVAILERMGLRYAVGTHDPLLVSRMEREASKGLVEFGFLKGLAEDTKLRLVKEGWEVAEYVPFGEHSEAYLSRRDAYMERLAASGRSPVP